MPRPFALAEANELSEKRAKGGGRLTKTKWRHRFF